MGTTTHTPSQGLFNEEPTLNYPGDCDIVGQVVGPNWLNEFYVIRETQGFYDHEKQWTQAKLALLTKDRQALLTTDARRGYVALRAQQERRNADSGFSLVPSQKELDNAIGVITRPHLWFQEAQ